MEWVVFSFVLEELSHALGRRSSLGFSPAVGQQPTLLQVVPLLSLTLLLPLPSEWLSTLRNTSPAFFFCIFFQFPKSCELHCQVPSTTYLLKACQVPSETRDMGTLVTNTGGLILQDLTVYQEGKARKSSEN